MGRSVLAAVAILVAALAAACSGQGAPDDSPAVAGDAAAVSEAGLRSAEDDRPRTDPAAFAQLFAQPRVFIRDLQYAGSGEAVAAVAGCKPNSSRCLIGIVVTDDGWRTERGVVLENVGVFFGLSVQAMPGGAAAVVVHRAGRLPQRFVLRPSGAIERLRLTTSPRRPRARALLTQRPARVAARHGEVWALDPVSDRLYPTRHQPCGCRRAGQYVEDLVVRPGGKAWVLVADAHARTTLEWLEIVKTRDNGRSWSPARAMPANYAPYVGGFIDLVAGPDSRLGLAWSSDTGTDYARSRLFVADNASAWRRVPLDEVRGHYAGMAFAADGRLIFSTHRGRVWRVGADGSVQALRDMPGGFKFLRAPGQGLIAALRDERAAPASFIVSRDGRRWRTITPGASLD